jgi:hypothetical protein
MNRKQTRPLCGTDDAFYNQITHVDCSTFRMKSVYSVTPGTAWPQASTKCCWNDHQPFDTPVWGIPVAKSGTYPNHRYGVRGFFCSYACARRGILETKDPSAAEQSRIYLEEIADAVRLESRFRYIAPPVQMLKSHGGELTLERFRGPLSDQIDFHYGVFMVPSGLVDRQIMKNDVMPAAAQTVPATTAAAEESTSFDAYVQERQENRKPVEKVVPKGMLSIMKSRTRKKKRKRGQPDQ